LLWSSLWVEISTLAYEAKLLLDQRGCQWHTVLIKLEEAINEILVADTASEIRCES
jgi:hypothetical protein